MYLNTFKEKFMHKILNTSYFISTCFRQNKIIIVYELLLNKNIEKYLSKVNIHSNFYSNYIINLVFISIEKF